MEQVFLFETILFYQGAPCFYSIYSKGDQIIGEPQPHHYYANIGFPRMEARHSPENWEVSGTEDAGLIQQLITDLKSFRKRLPIVSCA